MSILIRKNGNQLVLPQCLQDSLHRLPSFDNLHTGTLTQVIHQLFDSLILLPSYHVADRVPFHTSRRAHQFPVAEVPRNDDASLTTFTRLLQHVPPLDFDVFFYVLWL